MLDGVAAMTRFLRRLAAEPDIAAVPVMVDSSKWSVLEAGLRQLQGRGVVNSICLKEGEAEFLRQARLCRRYGAAAVVMAFDEQGQADIVERRVEVLHARPPAADGAGGLRQRGHHPRPQHLRDRDRHRGARRLRGRLLRGDPAPQGGAARRAGQRRRVQRLVRVPRQRPRPRGDPRRLPVPRDPGRPGHGDRQRRRAPACTTTSTRTSASASRTSSSTGARTPPSGSSRSPPRYAGGAAVTRTGDDLSWRELPVERAADPRAGRGHRRVHRGGHGGGPAAGRAAAGRDRGAADGRHERRRRPVRRRAGCSCPRWSRAPG